MLSRWRTSRLLRRCSGGKEPQASAGIGVSGAGYDSERRAPHLAHACVWAAVPRLQYRLALLARQVWERGRQAEAASAGRAGSKSRMWACGATAPVGSPAGAVLPRGAPGSAGTSSSKADKDQQQGRKRGCRRRGRRHPPEGAAPQEQQAAEAGGQQAQQQVQLPLRLGGQPHLDRLDHLLGRRGQGRGACGTAQPGRGLGLQGGVKRWPPQCRAAAACVKSSFRPPVQAPVLPPRPSQLPAASRQTRLPCRELHRRRRCGGRAPRPADRRRRRPLPPAPPRRETGHPQPLVARPHATPWQGPWATGLGWCEVVGVF